MRSTQMKFRVFSDINQRGLTVKVSGIGLARGVQRLPGKQGFGI
jgi:hypothetical protein